jgi:hypothetical protein
MDIHWSYRTVPELQVLPEAARFPAWRSAHRAGLRHWQPWVVFVVAVLLVPLSWVYFGSWFALPSWLFMLITVSLSGVGAGVFGHVCMVAARRQLQARA